MKSKTEAQQGIDPKASSSSSHTAATKGTETELKETNKPKEASEPKGETERNETNKPKEASEPKGETERNETNKPNEASEPKDVTETELKETIKDEVSSQCFGFIFSYRFILFITTFQFRFRTLQLSLH